MAEHSEETFISHTSVMYVISDDGEPSMYSTSLEEINKYISHVQDEYNRDLRPFTKRHFTHEILEEGRGIFTVTEMFSLWVIQYETSLRKIEYYPVHLLEWEENEEENEEEK